MRQIVQTIAMSLPSVNRATYWWLLYREYLYKGTLFEARLRAKLTAAQDVAADEVRKLEEIHGTTAVWLYPARAMLGLTRAPGWSSGWHSGVRSMQCSRREAYWTRMRDPARAHYWRIRRIAVDQLRALWPVSLANAARAERWLVGQGGERARLEQEARTERQAIEQRRADQERRARSFGRRRLACRTHQPTGLLK